MNLYMLETMHKIGENGLLDSSQEHFMIWVKWVSRVKQDLIN